MNPVRTLLLSLLLLSPLAQAHTHLLSSRPAADSTAAAPEQFTLEFNEATRLTALSIGRQGSQDVRKLGPLPAQPQRIIQIAAPRLDAAVYILTWRGVGDDGHVRSGTIRFTVVAR